LLAHEIYNQIKNKEKQDTYLCGIISIKTVQRHFKQFYALIKVYEKIRNIIPNLTFVSKLIVEKTIIFVQSLSIILFLTV